MPTRPVRKIIAYLLVIVFMALVSFDLYRMMTFIRQGARFTAADGQALCERVRALEAASYGYRDAGKTPQVCDYLERK